MSDSRRRIIGKGSTGALHRRVRSTTPKDVGREGKLVSIWHDDLSIAAQLLHTGPRTSQRFRHQEYLHVSDLIGKCIRKVAIVERVQAAFSTESLMDAHALTYAQGHAIHDYVRQKIMANHPLKVWGRWSCLCGHTTTEPMLYGRVGKHLACERCLLIPSIYTEVPQYNEEYKIVGSPDLVIYEEQYECFIPIEIKSMAANQWKDLSRPIPDHVVQVSFYWWLMKENHYSLSDLASILYVNKEYAFKSPYKEYLRTMSDTAPKLLKDYLADAKMLVDSRNGGKLPPRLLCGSPDAPNAKKCEVCATCFGLKE